ncbi:endonuclease/exonuclease/phosphatase family protein [Micromonosporaceae bacterium Da 78-11]
MTWNIKTGGVDRGRGDRLAAIASVIAAERPDLLALQELRDFDKHDGRRMREVADSVGMVAHLARSVFGQPVAVLVRPPLATTRSTTVTWRLHHAAAAATVRTAAGPLTLISTHLNPFRPERRRREATWLTARFSSPTELAVLAGDLNSLDPGTDHGAEIELLPAHYRRRHVDTDGTVNTRAITAFEHGGLLDLWRPAGSGDGRTAPTTQGGGAEFSGMRLDYVLGTKPLVARARDAYVVRGGDAEHASDHYPVRVDLDL